VRWMAAELLYPEAIGLPRFQRTFATDVYAFACLCLEVSARKLMDVRSCASHHCISGVHRLSSFPGRSQRHHGGIANRAGRETKTTGGYLEKNHVG
jgi:hypothetical protein